MADDKTVKLVIPIDFFVRETDLSLDFNSRANMSGKWLNFPKSQITDFKKIVTKFRKWNSSSMRKSFSFRIPLWMFMKNMELLMHFRSYDIIIEQFRNSK